MEVVSVTSRVQYVLTAVVLCMSIIYDAAVHSYCQN
jgi:hypothetical protein